MSLLTKHSAEEWV